MEKGIIMFKVGDIIVNVKANYIGIIYNKKFNEFFIRAFFLSKKPYINSMAHITVQYEIYSDYLYNNWILAEDYAKTG